MAKTAEAAPRVPITPGAAAAAVAVAATAVKHETVDEPQYAFDPSTIDDLFNIPLFIPGAANEGINVEELDFADLNIEQPQDTPHPSHEHPHYDADRVFYQSAEKSGIKTGWYFTLRGGKTHGPFGSHEAGTRVLNEMIEQFKRTGDTGGR